MYSPIQIMMFKSVEGDIQHFQKVALSSIGYVGVTTGRINQITVPYDNRN